MAYYDRFSQQKPGKADEWRNDEYTRRPQRDGKPSEDRRQHAGKDGWRDRRPSYAEKGGSRPQRYDDRRPARPEDRRPRFDEKKPAPDRRRFEAPEQRPAPFREEPVQRENALPENLLIGRNPIREALRTDRDIEKLLITKGEMMGSARQIVAMAREKKIIVQEVDSRRLDEMAPGHQGMIAIVSAYSYHTVEDMLKLAEDRGEKPFLVVLDGITDPHNLGAIIRSAECAGCHGVIIPERRAVGLTPAAVKSSAGAVEYLPVAKVTNLTRTLEMLKKQGLWVFGTAAGGTDYRKVDFDVPAVLVIGSEGEGISRLVADHCDYMVGLPLRGSIESLNASVAAGILLYAMADKREKA